jgi:hypothetical protein
VITTLRLSANRRVVMMSRPGLHCVLVDVYLDLGLAVAEDGLVVPIAVVNLKSVLGLFWDVVAAGGESGPVSP